MSEFAAPASAKVSDSVPKVGFGLFFIVMSLICAFQLADEIKLWRQTASWDETPCFIEHIDIKQVFHGKGGPTRESRMVYRYQHAAKEHHSSTISLRHVGRERAPLPEGMHAVLQTHFEAGTPYRCFVNPASPAESVLFRDLNTRDVLFYGAFMMGFFGVGLMAIFKGIPDACRQKAGIAR